MSSSWEPPALSRVDVDEVWKSLGRYGRYQVLQILPLMLTGMFMSYPVLSGVFEGKVSCPSCSNRSYSSSNNSKEKLVCSWNLIMIIILM